MMFDEVLDNTMIVAYALDGYIEQAEHCLSQMVNAGVTPNRVSYNSVIDACERKGDEDRAEYWQSQMAGVRPNEVSYDIVIHALLVKGEWQRAEQSLSQMMLDGVRLNAVSYIRVFNACWSNANIARAEHWAL